MKKIVNPKVCVETCPDDDDPLALAGHFPPFATHAIISEQPEHLSHIFGFVPSEYPAQIALKILLELSCPRIAAVLTKAVGKTTTPRSDCAEISKSKNAFGAS